MEGDQAGERPGSSRRAHRRTARRDHSRPDDADDGWVRFLDELRGRSDWHYIPVAIITGKDLSEADRNHFNGGVERIIQKSDRDQMLRQLRREIGKCVKREITRVA
jgi:hypothetical protein